ncbi:MAG: hypothetical protein D6744_12290, partial [Planctomycetota bacterium]
ERLLAAGDAGEYRSTSLYYLGLINLERGLQLAGEAAQAKAEERIEDARMASTNARDAFERAQGYFEEVVAAADPTVEPLKAALLLGIAQLASEGDETSRDEVFDLALRAENTLRRYVNEVEFGKRDRFGWFYLGVAQYRLADEYDRQQLYNEHARSLREASASLAKALELTEADVAAGRLEESSLDAFRTVVRYYEALLAIQGRDNSRARILLREVQEKDQTALGDNARRVLEAIEEVEAATPTPLSIPVPGPIGPIEIDGRVRIGNWFDTNVILLGDDTQLPLGFPRDFDYQYGVSAEVNIQRYISKGELPGIGESLSIGIGGETSHVWNASIGQFDINRYIGRAYVNWQPAPDWFLGFQFEHSFTQLGHKPFISSNRLSPVISRMWRANPEREVGRTDFYYTYDARDYRENLRDFRLNRDGEYQAIGLQHTFFINKAKELPWMQSWLETHQDVATIFGEQWLSAYIGYVMREERTIGTEFDLNGNSLIWGIETPLPWRLMFGVSGEFTWSDYSGVSVFDFRRNEREDFLQVYRFGLTHTLVARGEFEKLHTLEVKLRGGIELSFQNSNIWDRLGEDIYEYDRAVYGLELEVSF